MKKDKIFPMAGTLRVLPFLLIGICAAQPSLADDGFVGNGLNPAGENLMRTPDERGLSTTRTQPSRSPGGLFYETPPEPLRYRELLEGWGFYASAEAGYLFDDGEERAERFVEYTDWDEDILLNNFNLSGLQAYRGDYLEVTGGGVGRDDQYYRGQFGRYGLYKVLAFHNEIPHVFWTNGTTIYDGAGTDTLTLPAELVPGQGIGPQVAAVATQNAKPVALDLQRGKTGLSFETTPSDHLKYFARYSFEEREGTRPFGGAFAFTFIAPIFGSVAETIEPIDYNTHDISLGSSWEPGPWRFNVLYNGSFFRNRTDTLTFDNPFNIGTLPLGIDPGTFTPEQGRFALYPDNDFHNIKADVARELPLNGMFNTTLSVSRTGQDDELLPATINSGTVGAVNLDNWNTTDGLSRDSSDLSVDTLLSDTRLNVQPWNDLTLLAGLRYSIENHDNDYTAFNPQTGQLGYIITDGGLAVLLPEAAGIFAGVFVPGTNRVRYRSIPFDQEKGDLTLDAEYRLAAKTTLNFGYQLEQITLDNRETDRTLENRFKAALFNRNLSWATLRLSYEFAVRDNDGYDSAPYEEFYTTAFLPPEVAANQRPHTLAQLRKHDLTDRSQNLVKAQTNFLLRDDMDFFVSGSYEDNDHDADYGRVDESKLDINAEWSYVPSDKGSLHIFYGFQQLKNGMATINDVLPGNDPNAGGSVFPLSNAWDEREEDTSHMIGAGLSYRFWHLLLESSYSYVYSKGEIVYDFASAGALPGLPAELAGNSFSDLLFKRHILETSLTWPMNDRLSLRLLHHFEDGTVDDWHYEGISPVIDQNLLLATSPQDFTVNIFAVLLQAKL